MAPETPVLTPEDIAGLPGGPFTEELTAQAVAAIRAQCGWHIAPARSETVTLVPGGAALVLLPSLHVTAVERVVDVTSRDRPRELAEREWRWFPDGRIHLGYARPVYVEVTFTHGYEAWPEDLAGLAASYAGVISRGGRIKNESLSGHSVGLDVSAASGVNDPVLARYTLPGEIATC